MIRFGMGIDDAVIYLYIKVDRKDGSAVISENLKTPVVLQLTRSNQFAKDT